MLAQSAAVISELVAAFKRPEKPAGNITNMEDSLPPEDPEKLSA